MPAHQTQPQAPTELQTDRLNQETTFTSIIQASLVFTALVASIMVFVGALLQPLISNC